MSNCTRIDLTPAYIHVVKTYRLFHIIMPGRRTSNISHQTRNAIRLRNIVDQSTEERQNAHEIIYEIISGAMLQVLI